MQVKFAFFLSRYQPFVFCRKANGRLMTKIIRQGQETFQKTTISNHVQMLRERFLALLLIGLLPFLFAHGCYVTSMSVEGNGMALDHSLTHSLDSD